MSEMLSQDDIDSLLSAVARPSRSKYYDWKHPLAFSGENLRVLQEIHEEWNRLVSFNLSTQTESLIQAGVASIDQLTWVEFIRSIPNPSLITTITLEPMQGLAILQFDPALAFPLIDLAMGGEGRRMLGPVRKMTLVEQNLMEGLVISLLGNLREAWSGLLDLRPRLASIEVEPHRVQVLGPHEPVALVSSQVRISAHGNQTEGMMNLCLPWLTLAPFETKLRYAAWYGESRQEGRSGDSPSIQSQLFSRPVTIWGNFPWEGPAMTLGELSQAKRWKGSKLRSADYVRRSEDPRHD